MNHKLYDVHYIIYNRRKGKSNDGSDDVYLSHKSNSMTLLLPVAADYFQRTVATLQLNQKNVGSNWPDKFCYITSIEEI